MPSSASSANRPRTTSRSQHHNNSNNNNNNNNTDQPPIPISITICGDGGCGKSSITLRLVRSQWTSEYDPTIEDSYSITRRVDGAAYHLGLTDTAGQEEYRGMWASSNLGADAFLMVYDITSRASLDALQYFSDLVDMEAETRLDNARRARRAGVAAAATTTTTAADWGGAGGNGGPASATSSRTVAPVKIVAGNKCDLQESRQVSAATGLDWARRRGCGFMETSARLEVNIEETFALIVRRVAEARRLAEMGGDCAAGEDGGNGGNGGGGVGAGPGRPYDRRGATKPLSPLPGSDVMSEKAGEGRRGLGGRGPNIRGARIGGGDSRFWRKLRCW